MIEKEIAIYSNGLQWTSITSTCIGNGVNRFSKGELKVLFIMFNFLNVNKGLISLSDTCIIPTNTGD